MFLWKRFDDAKASVCALGAAKIYLIAEVIEIQSIWINSLKSKNKDGSKANNVDLVGKQRKIDRTP